MTASPTVDPDDFFAWGDESDIANDPAPRVRAATRSQSALAATSSADLGVLAAPPEWYIDSPPARRWLVRDTRTRTTASPGDGVLPHGRVGLLVAAGGAGKTMALAQLAVAIATGTTWLGYWGPERPGRALMLLAEEDDDEVHRRLYFASRSAHRIPTDGAIDVAALHGREVALLCRGAGGDPIETPILRALMRQAVPGRYDVIMIDPLSRFAGAEAEVSASWATRYVSVLEALAVSSGATILSAHHSAQWARRRGAADRSEAISSRGVTGLVDGARWVATLESERVEVDGRDAAGRLGETVTIAVAKSSYGLRPEPIVCRRDHDHGGALVPLDAADLETVSGAREPDHARAERQRSREAERATAEQAEDAAVLQVVGEEPGISVRNLTTRVRVIARCGQERAEVAIARARERLDVRPGPSGAKLHYLRGGASQ